MKATLLEQMKRDYIHIKHTKTVTRQQVERQEEVQCSTIKPLTTDLSRQVCSVHFLTYSCCLFLVQLEVEVFKIQISSHLLKVSQTPFFSLVLS